MVLGKCALTPIGGAGDATGGYKGYGLYLAPSSLRLAWSCEIWASSFLSRISSLVLEVPLSLLFVLLVLVMVVVVGGCCCCCRCFLVLLLLVGNTVGDTVGDTVIADTVGDIVGDTVRYIVGESVGDNVSNTVGDTVTIGDTVGMTEDCGRHCGADGQIYCGRKCWTILWGIPSEILWVKVLETP